MLFLSGGAVNLFKIEEVILYENRMKDRRRPILNPFYKLVTTTGINIVGSITFRHLRQLILIYRVSFIDRLFPRAVKDFKVSSIK
jgi:hypothetical protein